MCCPPPLPPHLLLPLCPVAMPPAAAIAPAAPATHTYSVYDEALPTGAETVILHDARLQRLCVTFR